MKLNYHFLTFLLRHLGKETSIFRSWQQSTVCILVYTASMFVMVDNVCHVWLDKNETSLGSKARGVDC